MTMLGIRSKSLVVLRGFTLAELLIALGILAILAVFTIPKLFTQSIYARDSSRAKDIASMIGGAYQQHKLSGLVTATTRTIDLTPYFNYVSYDTNGRQVDTIPRFPTPLTFSNARPCLKMADGGTLVMDNNCWFGGTTSLNHLVFFYDPDSTLNGDYVISHWNWPGKSIEFVVYADGFVTTRNNVRSGSI